ncbi:hypothetical protein, partial [Actinoplanes sichuanensis]
MLPIAAVGDPFARENQILRVCRISSRELSSGGDPDAGTAADVDGDPGTGAAADVDGDPGTGAAADADG